MFDSSKLNSLTNKSNSMDNDFIDNVSSLSDIKSLDLVDRFRRFPCTEIISSIESTNQDDGWQLSKHNVRERNTAMFLNELMSDVYFIFNSTISTGQTTIRIPAHKYVLCTSSSVFYAMFYGPLADENCEIKVEDVEADAFITMLRYLYCDQINFKFDSVLSVLYCAKKYLLPHLSTLCVKFLESNLSASNVCLLLSQSRLFDETELVHRCFEVIDAQTELVMSSDTFTNIDYDTLKCILQRDTLTAKEIVIFNSTLKWALAECERQKLKISLENQRAVLKDIMFLVRIPTLTIKEFSDGPAQSSILTLKAYRSNQWRYRGRCDSIQFSVDKRIFVVGFGLYGSSNGSHEYKVTIELKQIERVLATCHCQFYSDGSSNTFPVLFDCPIQIEADTFYIASAILDGKELSYFGQDGLNELTTDCGVNFQFKCSLESTNGTGVQGGQIPEILFYATQRQSVEEQSI
ncbi:hypothetical protein RDWZM_009387 [Blomia tropicalis]|uniref:BTB domain-containing protein n=1 Tax=Blomia tropicalis TaxID=40697 RepID=A0A9Q0RL98_BLOTA|nr:hypothetical protein RDWZM_009387 [Blomia tropicalis]